MPASDLSPSTSHFNRLRGLLALLQKSASPWVWAWLCVWGVSAWGLGVEQPNAHAARRVKVDEVKVVVNDKVITQREFSQLVGLRKVQYQRTQNNATGKTNSPPPDFAKQVLQEVIENLLLESHAEQLRLRVEEKTLDAQVDRIYRSNPQIEAEMSEADLKTILQRDLLRRQVISQQVEYRVVVSERDIKQACMQQSAGGQERDIGHILLRNLSKEEALKRIAKLRGRLLGGDAFEALASQFSQDPSAKANQGRLGFVGRGELVDAFEKVAFGMQVGEVSQAVKTQFGWHLIKVFGVRREQGTNCKQLSPSQRQRFQNQAHQQQRNQRLKALFTRLKKHADIVIF